MKQLLTFFLTALLAFSVGWAETVTFVAGTDVGSTTNQSNDSMTKDGITISSTSAGLAYAEYRFYNGTITISSTVGDITSVVFTCTTTAYANVFADATTSAGSIAVSGSTVTWTGSSSSFTIRNTAQSRASQIVVTTSGASSITEVATIADAYATAQNTQFLFTGNAVVTYQSGSNLWIRDDSGSGLIYGSGLGTYTNGDILNSGWKATNVTYNGIPEFSSPSSVSSSTNDGTVEPLSLNTLSNADVNKYASLSNVTVTSASGNDYYIQIGGTTFHLRNQYGLVTLTQGKTYNVTGIVTLYNNQIQFNLLSATEVSTGNPLLLVSTDELTISDSGVGNTFTVDGSNLGNDNVGVTVPVGSFSTTTDDQWWGFINNGGSVNGTVTVTYTGLDLSATGTVRVANNIIETLVNVTYVADLFIVGNDGSGWDFSAGAATAMTYNNGIYTATLTNVPADTRILFARKTGETYYWENDDNRLFIGAVTDGSDWRFGNNTSGNLDTDPTDDNPVKYHPIWFPEEGNYTITIDASNGTFTITKETEGSGDFVLVTDASQLAAGNQVIIVSSGSPGDAQAMSTTQNTNNRPGTDVTVTTASKVVPTEETQIFTLEGDATNGWYFNTGNGYIYAASSTNNYLRTHADADANAKATIDVNTTTKAATITFQGTNTRNLLRYNSTGHLFSCYASGQQNVYLYQRVASSEPSITVNPSSIAIEIPAGSNSEQGSVIVTETNTTGTTSVNISGTGADHFSATLNNGTLTVTYNGTAPQDNPDAATVILTNGAASATVTVTGYKIPLTVTFNPASGATFTGTSMDGTLSANVAGATIYYSLDGGQTWQEYTDGFTVTVATVGQSATVQAYAVYNNETSATVSATYTRVDQSATLYEKVTSVDQIQANQQYILVYEDTPEAMDGITTGGTSEPVAWYAQGSIVDIAGTDVIPFTLGGNADALTLSCASGYLAPDAPGLDFSPEAVNWSAEPNDGGYVLMWGDYMLRYNSGASLANGRFRIYDGSTGVPVYLYVKTSNLSTTLAFIESSVTENSQVTVSDELIGVWAVVNPDKGINQLWAKDQNNASIDKTFKTDEQIDYLKDLWGLETKDEWDQSNWVVLDFNGLPGESAFEYESRLLTAGTVKGKYADAVNYTIELTDAPEKVNENSVTGYPGYNNDHAEGKQGVTYYYNHYIPANFVYENLNEPYGNGAVAGNESSVAGTQIFLMNPKIQEVAQVWGVWRGNDRFDMLEKSGNDNSFDLHGSFDVLTWDLNCLGEMNNEPYYGSPFTDDNPDALEPGKPYLFHVFISRVGSSGMRDGDGYGVSPADIPAGHPEYTAVKDVKDVKTVASVSYFNVMGVQSDKPFEGINIIVTRYSDGSVSTYKVMR